MNISEIPFRDRQRKMREDAILEATHKLLAEKGAQAMTMDDLANRVGIAKGSLYQHFKSKEELLSVALVSFMNRISDYIDSLPTAQPAIERFRQTYRKAFQMRFGGGFPDILSFKTSSKDRQPAYVAAANRLVGALGGLFDTAKKQGDITQEIPTEILVYAAIGRVRDPQLDVLISDCRVQPEALVEMMVQMFLGGVITDWQRSKMRRMPRV